MSIILEGPDLSGKTTIAKKIGWDIIKRSNARGTKKALAASLEIPAGPFIWDRWWLSEVVYGNLFRVSGNFSIPQLWQMALRAETRGASLLYCPSLHPEEIKKRFEARGDSEWTFEEVLKVHAEYTRILPMYAKFLPTICETPEEAMREHVFKEAQLAVLKEVQHEGWGCVKPNNMLLIGDEEHFFLDYLYNVLDRTSLTPGEVYIVNSINTHGRYPDFKALIHALKPYCILCMGANASRRLRAMGVSGGFSVPHFSYWEKVHSTSMKIYAERIERIVKYARQNPRTAT